MPAAGVEDCSIPPARRFAETLRRPDSLKTVGNPILPILEYQVDDYLFDLCGGQRIAIQTCTYTSSIAGL